RICRDVVGLAGSCLQLCGSARWLACIDWARMCREFSGATVRSAVPWMTRLGIGRARVPIAERMAWPSVALLAPACPITANAEARSLAERYGSPEWIATAANTSG